MGKKFFKGLIGWGSLCLLSTSEVAFANHSLGLHLQMPNKSIEIRVLDIEELQLFQLGKNKSGMVIRLKPTAAQRITSLTEPLVGKTVVWVWNGHVISMEKLSSPLGKDLNILNIPTIEAEEFSQKIHS